MGHGGMRRFCVGHTALAKLDFLLDFAVMIFKPFQGVDFIARDLAEQFFGFVEAASLVRGFRLIAQYGQVG